MDLGGTRHAVADCVALLEESGKNCACGADDVRPERHRGACKAKGSGRSAAKNGRIDHLYEVSEKQYCCSYAISVDMRINRSNTNINNALHDILDFLRDN